LWVLDLPDVLRGSSLEAGDLFAFLNLVIIVSVGIDGMSAVTTASPGEREGAWGYGSTERLPHMHASLPAEVQLDKRKICWD